jgi:cytochrome c oxidase subunit IV
MYRGGIMNFLFGILGMVGGILCAIGDMLFDLKGNDSIKLGKYKFIESNWETMPLWRFKLSILFASVGVPLYVLGFISMARQISNTKIAVAFGVISCLGSLGGIMIHTLCCVFPILYKSMRKKLSSEEAEECLDITFEAVKIPFVIYFLLLVIIPSFLLEYAIIRGYLQLPFWCALFTAVPFMIVGVGMRLIKKEWFNDLPGIIMPSMGVSMVGLLAAINAIL